jgi:hypothetical protein
MGTALGQAAYPILWAIRGISICAHIARLWLRPAGSNRHCARRSATTQTTTDSASASRPQRGGHCACEFPAINWLRLGGCCSTWPRSAVCMAISENRPTENTRLRQRWTAYRVLVSSASIMRRFSCRSFTFASAGAITSSASVASNCSSPSYRYGLSTHSYFQ